MKLFDRLTKKLVDRLVSPDYLADITGTSPDLGLGEYLEKTGVMAAMPGFVQDRYKEAKEAQDEGVHQYLCNLDKEAASGKKNNCGQSKAWNAYSQEVARVNGSYILDFRIVGQMPLVHERAINIKGRPHSLAIPKPRQRPGTKGINGVDGRFSRQRHTTNRSKYLIAKVDTTNPDEKIEVERFTDAVEGGKGRTIGQRALYYDHNGKVQRGTGAIGREGREVGLSASTATLNQTTGDSLGATPTAAAPLKVAQHPNKKRAGETTDNGSPIGGLAVIGLISVAMAALLPMHFVTSAITFLNSVVTFMTNTRNAIATYTSMIDALLGLFGMRGATQGFRDLIGGILDNAFGKENIAYAKATFASTLNSVATGVKLAEKIEQARRRTDNKVDDLAIGLGTVNEGLKDAGVIPPDSPFMRASSNVDQFVAARTEGEEGEATKDNIYKLTAELKTHEEVDKELAEEESRRQKERKKTDKQIDDAGRLAEGLKTSFDARSDKR
jgi:hypothetical protein